jgi:hypothetical protein
VPRSYLLSRYGLDDEEDQYGTGSYVAPTLGSPLLSRYGMNDSLTPEPFNPPQPTDTLTPQAWAEQEAQQPSFFNRSEVKGNAIGSGIAQGMYDIASAWNSWMGDDETAKLYSQLSGNLDHLAEQQSTGYVENTVRAVTRSLTMAAPTIGLGAAAGAAAVPALGVSAAAAGLIGLGTGTASLLALSVPVTGTEADMQADQLIEQGLMKPEDKTTFVHNEMKIEGVLTALFSAIPGAQGVQRAAMPAVKEASRSVAKEIFKMIGGELAEEELIAIGHNVNKMYHAFDPNRGTVSQLTQGIFDTAVQTILGAGVVGGANYGIRSYIDGEKQQTPVTDPTPTQQQGVIEPQPTPVVEDSPIAPSGIIQKKYQENDSLPPQPVRELSKQERIGNIELKDVQTAFPDANIYDTDEEGAIGWDVQTAQGNDIKIRFSEKFKLTDKQLDSWEESYGRKFTPEQRKRWKDGINKVNGINRIVVGEDGYTPGALIQLRLDTADKSTLLHEVGHFAWKNLYTKDEKNGLVKKYSDPSLPLRQQEEDVMQAIAKTGEVHSRVRDYIDHILYSIGLKDIDAGVARALIQSEKLWSRGAKPDTVIGADQLGRKSYATGTQQTTPPTQGQLATPEYAQQLYDQDPEAVNEYLGSAPTVKALEKLTGYGRAKLPTTQKEREKLQSMLEFSRDAGSKDEQKARRKEARLKRMEQTGIPSSDPMYQAIAALDVDGPKAANAPDALKKMGIEKLFGLDPTSQTMVAEGMTGKQVSALSNTRIKTLFRIKDGTALGAAVEYGDNDNAIFMNKKTLRDQDIYNRVLGHESGHVLANLKVGDDTMMSAIFDIQGTMPDLDKQIEILTQADKAAAAKLGYTVDETQQGLFEEGKAVPNAKEQKYLDLRDDLFYAFKKKATNLRVRFTEGEYDEATKLSLLIRSFNPRMAGKAQLKDRYSIHEVYADAMTVFFNAPEVIQENAPLMWKRINEAIAHKQEFLGKYIEIQAAMNGESSKLAKLQSDFIKGRIKDPGDALRYHMHNRMKQKDDYNYRFLDSLLKAFIDKTTPATSHLNDVELQAYIKSRLEQFGHASFRVVKEFKPLDDRIQNLGMDADDVSLMMVGEVVKARSQMEGDLEVFTGGSTEEMFNRNEQEMIKKYGEAKVSQLKSITQERNEKTFIPALRTLNKIGEISDEAMQSIEESSPWYSPLLSQHHLQETGYVSGGLQQMTGDLGDKVDPHVGSLLKAMSAAEYAERRSAQNAAVRTKVDMLGLETVNSTDKPQKPAGYGQKWIQEYLPDDKGRMVKQWVMMDKVDAESIYGTPRSDMDMKVTKLNNIMYRFFYPLLLTFRGAYMPRQFSKDIFRTLKNTPAMVAGQTGEKFSTTKFLMNLPKAARLAKDTVYGTRELPSEVSDLIAKGHIDPVVNDYVTRLHMLADEDIDRQRTITEIMERGGYRLHDKQHQIAVNKKLTKLQKAERFMNNLANFQNMTVKIAGAMEVERAFNGRTPETAAWITQNFVGTPNLNQRSDLSGALNLASFFSRVALTGIKADLMAFKNSKSTAEYAKNWMAYAAMPKLLKYAALYGLLGEAMKQMWEKIPEYERDKQNAIPFGLVVDTDGKTKALYLSLFPSDPMGAVFDSMLDQFVRFYAEGKDQGNREGVMDEFGKVMEAFYQAQPLTSWNTPLQIYNVWGSFLRNENPRDPFFNNEIVTDEHRRQGVWASTQPMIRWTTSKFGAPSEYASGLLDALLGPLYPSVTETPKTKNLLGFIPVPVTAQGMLGAIPGVGQLVKISDRGFQEDIYELNSIQRDEEMWARDNMDKTSRDLTVLKERLSNEMAMGKVSPERRKKLAVYKVWESEAYTPLRAQAMEAHEAGDDKEAKRILGILKERSEQVKQGVELPEFAMSRVLIKLTDTPEEQRAATKSRKLGITVEPDQRAIDEKNNLKALLVAKQMPEIDAINYLRAGYISRMNDEQLYKVARQVGVTRTGLKSQVVAGVVNSKYSPETFKNGKLTAYGERVRRLKQLLK